MLRCAWRPVSKFGMPIAKKNRRGVPGNFFVLRQIALQYCLWACQVNYFAQIVVLVSFDVFDQFGHALIERRAFDLVEQAGWFAPFAPRHIDDVHGRIKVGNVMPFIEHGTGGFQMLGIIQIVEDRAMRKQVDEGKALMFHAFLDEF